MRGRWASLRRTKPLSRWGFERGTPIDRWYIERFLEKHQERVYGRTLEVLEDLYASRFGAAEVDVVDIDQGNALATIRGDLCRSDTLPESAFDAIVLTQTLQFLPNPRMALVNLVSALKPGATMLVTVPTLSRVADETDRWRWTPHGLEGLTAGLGCAASVESLGNLLTSRGFLMGLAIEDLRTEALRVDDPDFPVIVAARLDKPVDPASTVM
jgi:SAM-dependent methyltransferase